MPRRLTRPTLALDFFTALADRFAIYAKSLRDRIQKTDALNEMDTNDLYIEISRAIDKRLWFLEAHLQTATNTSGAATANTQSHAVKAGAKEAKALR